MKFLIVALTLLCLAVKAEDAVQPKSCIKLYIAVRHFLHLTNTGGEDTPAAMFSSVTGVDTNDDMAVKKFACEISGVKSLTEAEALMKSEEISVDVLEALYAQLLSFIEDQGGMAVMGKAYEIVTHVMEAGELLELRRTNFESIPVHVDPDMLTYMFEELVGEFGEEFVEMFFSETVPFDNISTLVGAITESVSLEEAARDLNVVPDQLERFLANFGHMISQEFLPLPFIKSAYFLLVTASEYGLLSLPVGH